MNEKVSSLIGKVTVNSPVFQSEIFSPTLINFFSERTAQANPRLPN